MTLRARVTLRARRDLRIAEAFARWERRASGHVVSTRREQINLTWAEWAEVEAEKNESYECRRQA